MIIKYWDCQNGFGHPGHGTLKSALYQEGINGMNWFLDPDANPVKLKVNYWVDVVENEGALSHETLISAVYQDRNDELSWFFACR